MSSEHEGHFNYVDTAGEYLFERAGYFLKGIDKRIDSAYEQVGRRREEYIFNFREFNGGCEDLNAFITYAQDISLNSDKPNALAVKRLLKNRPFPTPAQLSEKGDSRTLHDLDNTLIDIRGKLKKADWVIPDGITDPMTVAVGLIVKGYASYLGIKYDNPDIPMKFILGLEEIVKSKSPDSPLLARLSPWLRDEAEVKGPSGDKWAFVDDLLNRPASETSKDGKEKGPVGSQWDFIDDLEKGL